MSQPATENPVRTVVGDAIHHLPSASTYSDPPPHKTFPSHQGFVHHSDHMIDILEIALVM